MKYPRMPTGPSGFGAAGVRALQNTGGDWQTKRQSVGITSKQQGEFQRVIVEQDGWVSAGKVERSGMDALDYVTPSWRIEGGTDNVMNRRGSTEIHPLVIETPQKGAVAEVPIGYVVDGEIARLEYDGEMIGTTTAVLKLKSAYLPYGKGKHIADIAANSLPEYIPGATEFGRSAGGIAHDYLTSSESGSFYTGFQLGNTWWRVQFIAKSSGTQNPKSMRPTIHRLSPLELIGFVPGITSPTSGPRGSLMVKSTDNGQNWSETYDLAAIFTDRTNYSVLDPYAWDSDSDVYELRDRMLAAPLPSGVRIIAVGEGAYNSTYSGKRMRIYQMQPAATTLLAQEIPIGPGSGTFSTVFKHGGHHKGRPFMQFVDETTSKHYLWFVKEDGFGADYYEMPQPSHWTGRARALDEDMIQCTMYYEASDDFKAGYYICTSEDFGQTWKRHRLIKADPVAPEEMEFSGLKVNHTLQAFADAFLPRKNGIAANPYPGAPWIGDDTVTPPWE